MFKEDTMSENKPKISFIDFASSALSDGDYKLQIKQHVHIKTNKEDINNNYEHNQYFSVSGPQFSLSSKIIASTFPPSKSEGNYSNSLPHINIEKATLPWEREPGSGSGSNRSHAPWLALLLFDKDQTPDIKTMTVGDLIEPEASPYWPGCKPGVGQRNGDSVQVINVKESLLKKLLPQYEELTYLAHVRQEQDADNKSGLPHAIVISNRLPKTQNLTTVHLVSLENRYQEGQFDFGPQNNDQNKDQRIRLVTLYSWQFYCTNEGPLLTNLFDKLNRGPLKLPARRDINPEAKSNAEPYLNRGATILPHQTRTSDQLYSWYHGPLIPGALSEKISLPVHSSDQLLRFDQHLSMYDVSYAAAWELGRMLGLKNKNFSMALCQWKQNYAQLLEKLKEEEAHRHMPFAYRNRTKDSNSSDEVPEAIRKFFEDLRSLKGIPVNYLLPDERLLPWESIRFFHVDQSWLDALMDGAFSIGRHIRSDLSILEHPATLGERKPLSGFLLRSEIVSGWPDLSIKAYEESILTPESDPLESIQTKTFSNNIFLGIYKGDIQSITFGQQARSIHFGFKVASETPLVYEKILRNVDGDYYRDKRKINSIPFRDQELQIVNIIELAGKIAKKLGSDGIPMTSSLFAMEMVEGAPMVVFKPKDEH